LSESWRLGFTPALRGSRQKPLDPRQGASSLWHLAVTTFIAQLNDSRWSPLRLGGEMLFTIAFILLTVWLLGILGVYRVGDVMHVLLLIALMLLLVGFLKGRDAAARRVINDRTKQP
jgi:hypothetical protein